MSIRSATTPTSLHTTTSEVPAQAGSSPARCSAVAVGFFSHRAQPFGRVAATGSTAGAVRADEASAEGAAEPLALSRSPLASPVSAERKRLMALALALALVRSRTRSCGGW